MTEDYCELYDMPASMCAHCRGRTRTPEQEAASEDLALTNKLVDRTSEGWFRADYGGRCFTCRSSFRPGMAIRWKTDGRNGRGGWQAQCCAATG